MSPVKNILHRPILIILGLLTVEAILLPASGTVSKQTSRQYALNFVQAVDILRQSADGMGLHEQAQLTGINYTLQGDLTEGYQGLSVRHIDDPRVNGKNRIEVALDFSNDRYLRNIRRTHPDGLSLEIGSVFAEGALKFVLHEKKEYSLIPNAPASSIINGSSYFSPILLVRKALQNYKSAVWVGKEKLPGYGEANIVEFSWNESRRIRLSIDATDHKVRLARMIVAEESLGDDALVFEFVGDQTISGLWHPQRVNLLNRAIVSNQYDVLDVTVNPEFSAARFDLPDDYTLSESNSFGVSTKRVRGNVYEVSGLVAGLYRAQFIELKDFVIAFEAPVDVKTTQTVIDEIRKQVGDKPIKYVVLSHFHSDHAGGVGAYLEIGTTIISSADDLQTIERYAQINSRFNGESTARDFKMNYLSVSEKTTVYDSEGNSVEVLRFPENPHVDDMLVLYDPISKSVLNADLYSRITSWNQTYSGFADWLSSDDAPAVDMIFSTHEAPTEIEEFRGDEAERR